MNVTIKKVNLNGDILAPTSKSYTHRYLIASMLSNNESVKFACIPVDKNENTNISIENEFVKGLCKPKDIYGKIIKYDKLWEVHLLQDITKKVLTEKELGCEIQAIRKKWIDRGITKGDTDHNTKQYSHTGKRARYDCFMIKGGIQEPDSDEDVMIEPEEQQEAPISDYTIDDSSAIDEVFGGQDDNN